MTMGSVYIYKMSQGKKAWKKKNSDLKINVKHQEKNKRVIIQLSVRLHI